jgi:hypothetical protein
MEQQLLYLNKNYKILNAEQEFIIHPAAFGIIPITTTSLQCFFTSYFQINDYQLILNRLTIGNGYLLNSLELKAEDKELPKIADLPVAYNGAILIGTDLVKEYYMKGMLACFSYQSVIELVFEEGILITTIDQSKAMSRIRKNIELGLRTLYKTKDIRCIKHFISSAFVGDYKTFRFDNQRLKHVKDMQNYYRSVILGK